MTKNVVLIIVDSLYFFCHSRVSLSGIYKIIYYSSVIPAKQLSGNLSSKKLPFCCCRPYEQSEAIHCCRHCDCFLSFAKVYVFLLLSSLRAKAKQSIIKDNKLESLYFIVIPESLYRESIKK